MVSSFCSQVHKQWVSPKFKEKNEADRLPWKTCLRLDLDSWCLVNPKPNSIRFSCTQGKDSCQWNAQETIGRTPVLSWLIYNAKRGAIFLGDAMPIPLMLNTPLLVLLYLGGQIKHQEAVGGHRIRPLAGEWCFKALVWGWLPQGIGFSLQQTSALQRLEFPFTLVSVFPSCWTTPDTVCLHSPQTLHFPNSHELSASSS